MNGGAFYDGPRCGRLRKDGQSCTARTLGGMPCYLHARPGELREPPNWRCARMLASGQRCSRHAVIGTDRCLRCARTFAAPARPGECGGVCEADGCSLSVTGGERYCRAHAHVMAG